jgi:hypothetical protein
VKSKLFGTAVAVLVAGTMVHAREDIRVYTVPKENKAAQGIQNELAPATEVPAKWKTPAGWSEQPPANMVIASFAVPGKDGKKADVSITTFPGDVGGELANVNRWRRQLGLAEATEPGKSDVINVGGEAGKLYEIANDTSEIFVALVPHNGATWFFKVKGDKATVADAKLAFGEFLKSIQFTDSTDTTSADPHAGLNIQPATAVDPHAGLANGATDTDSGGPKMNAPATWKEKAPGPMVLKSYTVAGSKGGEATVAISSFPGDVGGKLKNVNRWRDQMGLAEVNESQLSAAAQSLETQGGTGFVVDIEGTDSKTGRPARLVAIAIPHAGNTWFYKLLGDKNTVEESKAAFLNFVKSVRY